MSVPLRRWLAAAGAVSVLACKTQAGSFCDKVFACDPNAAADPCGTTCDGKPMTCFAASSQLGGEAFCTEKCQPASPSSDSRFTCLPSGAKVQNCRPTAGDNDPALGCPPGLKCYRTDVLSDQGLCLMMNVCTTDADCEGNPGRRKCGATILRDLFPLPSAMIDHLACVQASCKSSGSLCDQNEGCLANFFDIATELPDICAPNCDSQLHCPPNYACVQATSGGGSPPICIPGVPGSRCETEQDCVVGECFDTSVGFGECALPLPCSSDADCGALNGPMETFVCAQNAASGTRRCVALLPFHGGNCTGDEQCPSDQKCFRFSPYVTDQGKGECRPSCDPQSHACAPRAGIPHVCLDDGAGGCYPGEFGLPCAMSSECLPEFTCQAVSADPRTVIDSPTICTVACTDDAACTANPFIRNGGFCKEGFCRLTGVSGAPCDRDGQCVHGLCTVDGAGNGQCAM